MIKMKFARMKQKPKLVGECFYVVMAQFRDGSWGVASFFGKPFAFSKYAEAIETRDWIINDDTFTYWQNKKHFKIAKITLGETK